MNQIPNTAITAANYDPHTIKFFDEEAKQVGELSMKHGELRFTGSADAAAKAFFNSVCDRVFQLTLQINILKQSNAGLLAALKNIVDVGRGYYDMDMGENGSSALAIAEDAIQVEGGGRAIDEHCTRCKGILPAFGHETICDSCDKMLEIYKQAEVIAELLGALKRLCNLPGNCQCEIGDDELSAYDNALYAIAKEEQRIK